MVRGKKRMTNWRGLISKTSSLRTQVREMVEASQAEDKTTLGRV